MFVLFKEEHVLRQRAQSRLTARYMLGAGINALALLYWLSTRRSAAHQRGSALPDQ